MIPFGSLSKYYSSNNNKMDKRNEFIVLSFYMISFAFVETSTRVYDHQLSSALSTIRTDDRLVFTKLVATACHEETHFLQNKRYVTVFSPTATIHAFRRVRDTPLEFKVPC